MSMQFDPNHILNFLVEKPINKGGYHLLIACLPKSGSTRLSTAISELGGFSFVWITPVGHAEQQPRTELLTLFHAYHWVAQSHIAWSEYLQQQLDAFQVTPVVLVRNMEDIVCSLHDHLHRESIALPMAWVNREHLQLSKEESWMFIVEMMVPWYLRFVVSWQHAPKKPIWLHYEKFTEDPIREMHRVTRAMGIMYTDAQLQEALDKADAQNTRKNVGRNGRGAEMPEAVRQRIRQLAAWYPMEDLSVIGL